MLRETNLRKDQMRRIEKLERESAQTSQFPDQLRAWARRFGVPEQAFLRAAKSHHPELRQELGGETVSWPVFQLLHDIAQLAAAEPVRPEKAA